MANQTDAAAPAANATAATIDNPFAIDFAQPEITGTVQRVQEFEDSDFVVVRLDGNRTTTGTRAPAEEDNPLQLGVAYRFFGTWTHHVKHGDQFAFDSYALAPAQRQFGVIAFLSRSRLGLTKANASRIWNEFGETAIQRLREDPGLVAEQCELDPAKVRHASELLRLAGKDESVKVALFELFSGHGFPRGTVRACIKTWGSRAPAVVRRDPFAMLVADLPGVGFKRADKLYLALGGNPAKLKRQMLAAWWWLASNGLGNTWEPQNGLYKAILEAAGSLDAAEFERAIALGIRSGWIAKRDARDWLAWLRNPAAAPADVWYAERGNAAEESVLARKVKELLA